MLPHTPKHTLWQPKPTNGAEALEPMWHLRVSVLKDAEGMGDCPDRRFVSLASTSSRLRKLWPTEFGCRHSDRSIISRMLRIN